MSLGTVQIGQFRMRCCSNKRERKLGGLQYLRRIKEYGKMNVNLSSRVDSLRAFIKGYSHFFSSCLVLHRIKFVATLLSLHMFYKICM